MESITMRMVKFKQDYDHPLGPDKIIAYVAGNTYSVSEEVAQAAAAVWAIAPLSPPPMPAHDQ